LHSCIIILHVPKELTVFIQSFMKISHPVFEYNGQVDGDICMCTRTQIHTTNGISRISTLAKTYLLWDDSSLIARMDCQRIACCLIGAPLSHLPTPRIPFHVINFSALKQHLYSLHKLVHNHHIYLQHANIFTSSSGLPSLSSDNDDF